MGSIKYFLIFDFLYLYSNGEYSLTRSTNLAFDPKIYEDALDSRLCLKQLDYIKSNKKLNFLFLDRGFRIPKYITKGNTVDFGSYKECLDISEQTDDFVIDGKYCMLKVTLPQNLILQSGQNSSETEKLPEKVPENTSSNKSTLVKLGLCLPKVCTTRESLQRFYNSLINLKYEDKYCRLRDDKPWTPADTVSTVLLSLIGLITLIGTAYDVYKSVILKDPKGANAYLKAFSVYTNTQKLLTHGNIEGSLECVDGVRAFATAWIIILHSNIVQNMAGFISNPIDYATWERSANSLWINSSPKSVDTFLTLSGMLVVYTNARRFTSVDLLKNLHLFYLNRLLRLFPVLAFVIVLQISLFHRVSDGPDWTLVADSVNDCRLRWWSTLIHLQNYINPLNLCLPHAWYLAVDTQLHVISPLVLFWVFSGNKHRAWIALIAGLLISLIVATVYIFFNEIGLMDGRFGSMKEYSNYLKNYYVNTLTRASPFFIGMIFGYILHLKRLKPIVMSKIQVAVFWVISLCISSAVVYSHYYQTNYSGENQIVANLINIFTTPAWSLAVGFMILACQHGYGELVFTYDPFIKGPIAWVLSLKELKLLSKISYSMYIFHYPMMNVHANTALSTVYFNMPSLIFTFLGYYAITFICGFAITLIVEIPASFFIKKLLERSKEVGRTSEK